MSKYNSKMSKYNSKISKNDYKMSKYYKDNCYYEKDYDNDNEYDNDYYDENDCYNENNYDDEKKNEFIGTIHSKSGWIKCFYCDKYHPNSMYLMGLGYCGHCWGWLNSNQLDLEKCIYKGNNTISEIKQYIKETFKLHNSIECTSKECVYNKIIDLEKNNKLHMDFCLELGFIKNQDTTNQVNTLNIKNKVIISSYKIKNKSDKINYKLSHITI